MVDALASPAKHTHSGSTKKKKNSHRLTIVHTQSHRDTTKCTCRHVFIVSSPSPTLCFAFDVWSWVDCVFKVGDWLKLQVKWLGFTEDFMQLLDNQLVLLKSFFKQKCQIFHDSHSQIVFSYSLSCRLYYLDLDKTDDFMTSPQGNTLWR